MKTTDNENTGTMKFEKPVETKREIEIGDSVYNTSGKFLAVCIGCEGAYVRHRTMNGTEGCNYEHYYVRIESILKENQELKAELQTLAELSGNLMKAMEQRQFFFEGYANGSASISECNEAASNESKAYSNLWNFLKNEGI